MESTMVSQLDKKSDDTLRILPTLKSLRHPSISRYLTISLVINISIVSIIITASILTFYITKEDAALKIRADRYIADLVEILKNPIWEVNKETINRIAERYTQNQIVSKLKIYDVPYETIYFEQDKEYDDNDQIHRLKGIEHEGLIIGKVEISFTRKIYKTNIKHFLIASLLIELVIITFLFFMTGILLRKRLKKPFKHIEKIVSSYSKGEYDIPESKKETQVLEFVPFLKVLNEMKEKINAQMEELRIAEENYRSIFENATEGIFRISDQGRFITANDALSEILGYNSPDEVIQQISSVRKQFFPEETDYDVFTKKLFAKGFFTGFETKVMQKNKNVINVSLNVHVVRDKEEKLQYYEGTLNDITERKQIEDKLEEYRNHLEELVIKRTDKLHAVNIVGQRLNSDIHISETKIVELIYNQAILLMDTQTMYIALFDKETRLPLRLVFLDSNEG